MRAKEYFSLFKNTFTEFSNDRAPRMGAALAYYVTFSIAPLLLIAVSIAGLIFGEQAARGEIFDQIQATVGPGAARSIEDMLANTSSYGGNIFMMIVGGVILIFGASGVFAELQDSLNQIFRAPPQQGTGIWNTVRRRFLSFSMVVGIAFLLLVSLVVSAALSALSKFLDAESLPGGVYLWQGLNLLVSLGIITLLFALIYKVLPDENIRWRDAFVGAALTAVLFTLGKFLLGLYLGQASTVSSFGAAGSFIVILIWVYYSAQILLFGAEFTRLYAERHGALNESAEQAPENEASEKERRFPGPKRGGNGNGRGNAQPRNRLADQAAKRNGKGG